MASSGNVEFSDAMDKLKEKAGGNENLEELLVKWQQLGMGRNRQEALEKLLAIDAARDEVVRKRREQKRAAGGHTKGCAGCGGKGKLRCKGCFLELYCGKHCQQAAWPGHKTACTEVGSLQVVTVAHNKYSLSRSGGNSAQSFSA
jgi:hypothetical protein